ncbi:alpha/beta hydrolase family protein [Herbihabitans rhizosphaerae]|uniref:Alpha/beta hydrolase family protein n=1 Tax=Herbihabitans rhizosphaerae TaxID=1872711 RepID=A0A4Q7KM59_9PSEU|nr:alpha/beta hydrolase [Herbihabitans rhizosphaerae]RZS36980.1 alpha/beta hydrolase family protein [Herbihabitans rhizosphaerae]
MTKRSLSSGGRRRAGIAALTGALAAAGIVLAPAAAAAPPRADEPDTAALAGALTTQKINWETCVFPGVAPEKAKELLSVKGVACATVQVPRDWHNPGDGNTIGIRVSKTGTAAPGATRQGIALVNPGGPGGSGLPWGAAMALRTPVLATQYDFVGFDPRGVGLSTPLTCEYTVPDSGGQDAINRAKVAGCLANPLTKFITTEQTAYDMDFIRVLLGEKKTSYIGYSYGTWLGTWYAATFPGKTHRFLLDSSTDASQSTLERTWDLQPRSRDRQFQEALLPYMARNGATYKAGTDPLEIRRAFEKAGGTREFAGMLMTAWFVIPAMYDTAQYPVAASAVASIVNPDTETGSDTNGDAQKVEQLVAKILALPHLTAENRAFVAKAKANALKAIAKKTSVDVKKSTKGVAETEKWDATFEAIRCQDGQWNQNPHYWKYWLADLTINAPFIAPFMDTPLCAYWPTVNSMPKPDKKTFPKVLIAQSELDAATPYEGALATAKGLPGAKMISVDNEGSHGLFPYNTDCVDDPIIAFFQVGVTPKQKFTGCQGMPLPNETATHEVGGHLGHDGKIKIKMITDEVRKANEIVKDLLDDATTPEADEKGLPASR